jgi:hypothetical protein
MGFTVAFLVGAVSIFYVARAAGSALGLLNLPFEWRVGSAGVGLLLLAIADAKAISRGTYCPLSWRRQTPKALIRRYPVPLVASFWGFDTGLVVTTVRVAATSCGCLLLAFLGLAPEWTGIAYGLGFILPFLFLLMRRRLGEAAHQARPMDPGLETMLRQRVQVQRCSALLLILSGAAFLAL